MAENRETKPAAASVTARAKAPRAPRKAPAAPVAAAPVTAAPVAKAPAKTSGAAVETAKAPAAQITTPKPILPPSAAVPAIPQIKEQTMATTIDEATTKINDAASTAQAQAKTMFSDMSDRTKGAMEKGAKMFEDMNDFTKGNVEAVVESSKIYARGVESFGQDAAAYAKKSYEDATAAFKAMASVKSPTDFFKLQGDYARAAFDAMVAETSKSTEKMVKLASEVSQPISNRVAIAVEKAKIAA